MKCAFVICTLIALPAVPAQAQPLFTEVTQEAGVAFRHFNAIDQRGQAIGTGAAWLDFNRDGHLDLYVTQGNGPNALFRNNGNGTFTNVARDVGAEDQSHRGGGVAVTDFDLDGWPDIYLANSDADVLLRNDSGRAFIDVTAAVGLAGKTGERGTSAAWGDYDLDGYPDLYVVSHMDLRGLAHSSRDRLFHNDGGTSFTEVTDLLDSFEPGYFAFAATWTDFDNDGDADLFVIDDCGFADSTRNKPMRLYQNDGGTGPLSWVFTDVAAEVGASFCRHGMGIAAGDYNRDGWIDYFFTNIGKQTTLLQNREGRFDDVAEPAGVWVGFDAQEPGAPFGGTYSWGATFFDYDLDGWLDLYVTAGPLNLASEISQPNKLFRNRGDGTFEDVSSISGLELPGRSRTSVYGDYDNDGDPDLYVVDSDQRGHLFRNDAAEGNYLILDLEDESGRPGRIGVKVRITTPDGAEQVFETRSGSSLGGSDDPAAYFGLGNHTLVSSIEIAWPSSSLQILNDVPANQRLTVREKFPAAAEAPPPGNGVTLDLYPIPSAEAASLRLMLQSPAETSIEIFDLTGRVVSRVDAGVLPAGQTLLRLHHLPAAGLYFVRATVGNQSISKPLFLVR